MSDVTPTLTITAEEASLVSSSATFETDANGAVTVKVALTDGPVSASVTLTVSVVATPEPPPSA